MDSIAIAFVIGSAVLIIGFISFFMLQGLQHADRVALDHYGKFRGSTPAKSFVCPDCLRRTYAPSHIARRWCERCKKGFSEKGHVNAELIRSELPPPRWFLDHQPPK